jgi:hypothetical protein
LNREFSKASINCEQCKKEIQNLEKNFSDQNEFLIILFSLNLIKIHLVRPEALLYCERGFSQYFTYIQDIVSHCGVLYRTIIDVYFLNSGELSILG